MRTRECGAACHCPVARCFQAGVSLGAEQVGREVSALLAHTSGLSRVAGDDETSRDLPVINGASRPNLAAVGVRKAAANADHTRSGGNDAIQPAGKRAGYGSVSYSDCIGKLFASVIASAE